MGAVVSDEVGEIGERGHATMRSGSGGCGNVASLIRSLCCSCSRRKASKAAPSALSLIKGSCVPLKQRVQERDDDPEACARTDPGKFKISATSEYQSFNDFVRVILRERSANLMAFLCSTDNLIG
jgi:hypothetical protein